MNTKRNLNESDVREINMIIASGHERILHEARAVAASYGSNAVDRESAEEYAAAIGASYEGVFARVKQITCGEAARRLGSTERLQAENTALGLASEMASASAAVGRTKLNRDRIMVTYPWKRYWALLVLEAVIVLGDVFFNAYAFSALGGFFSGALGASAVFAVALWVAAFYIPRRLARVASGFKRGLLWTLHVVLLVLAFGVLGVLRARHLGQSGAWLAGSAFGFAVINLFCIAMASWLSLNFPTELQVAEKAAFDRKDKEMRQHEKAHMRLMGERDRLHSETRERLDTYATRIAAEEEYRDVIASLSTETLAAYRAELSIAYAYSSKR